MVELYRFTVDEPNYSRLLREEVDLEQFDNLPDVLESSQSARIWAIKPGSEGVYDQLNPGDYLLFYLGAKYRVQDEGFYDAMGQVDEKFQGSMVSASALFHNPEAVRMLTVKNFERISKTPKDIRRILGYERHPQGPHRVRKEHYSSISRVVEELRS